MNKTAIGLVSVALSCALIASCGGGDDSPTPTPTPTSTDTGTPTPSPTPSPTAIDFDFTKAFTQTIFNTSYAYAFFRPDGGTEVWNDGSRRNGETKIAYEISPEKATFTWPDTFEIPIFAAADLQTATASLRQYRKGSDGLTMELPFDHILRVSFETSQAFTRETVAGTLRSFRNSIFYNPVTVTTAISTNLSFTGTPQLVGGKSGTTPVGTYTTDTTTLTINATDKKLSGSIRIYENVGGVPTLRATLPISATLGTGPTFAGSTEDTTAKFKGTFVGSLAGPNREEIFLIFNVASTVTTDGREFLGSLIAS